MLKAEVKYLFIYFGETHLNSIKSQSYALLEMWLLTSRWMLTQAILASLYLLSIFYLQSVHVTHN